MSKWGLILYSQLGNDLFLGFNLHFCVCLPPCCVHMALMPCLLQPLVYIILWNQCFPWSRQGSWEVSNWCGKLYSFPICVVGDSQPQHWLLVLSWVGGMKNVLNNCLWLYNAKDNIIYVRYVINYCRHYGMPCCIMIVYVHFYINVMPPFDAKMCDNDVVYFTISKSAFHCS